MRRTLIILLIMGGAAAGGFGQELKTFAIRFVSSDVVYLQGGAAAGLKEGMHLNVKRPGPGESVLMAPSIADLVVISVASTSAACEISKSSLPLQPGDQAVVVPEEREEQKAAASEGETYTQIVEFNDGDPLEEELRERVPKAPLREINRFGGRVGFEQDSILDRSGLGNNSSQQGVTLRFDFTRIGSSHWSFGGYWRARISARKRSVQDESITDVLQRVYQFGLRYENPQSRYALGLGRLMVPWAASLSTLDGGYFGAKLNKTLTIGAFAGTTPDPTAWNYDPNRQLGGAFASVDRGSVERIRYTLTSGIAISRLNWKPERQFAFLENGILFGQRVSLHHNLEADYRSEDRFASAKTLALTRSFATLRLRPVTRLTLDLSHNYFRVLPTPDERLLVTQQLGNLLFRGLNGGARLDLTRGLAVYANGGQSSRTEDSRPSWSGMSGLIAKVPGIGMRAEARFSRFNGTVGAGDYRSVSIRNDNSERWHFELEAGDQQFASSLSLDSKTWYGMGSTDLFIGRFVLGFRGTRYRGSSQKYDQLRASLDFRF